MNISDYQNVHPLMNLRNIAPFRSIGGGDDGPLERARKRFGGPFAHEPKTRWKQNATPVLTRWMAKENWSNQV